MEPFLGQIQLFGFNFPPRGWAQCDGQLLQISQNQALFSLLGTIYGGNGRTDFALPDLRGRLPMHMGTGPGLSNRPIGRRGGSEQTVLTVANLPAHSHPAQCNGGVGNGNVAAEKFWASDAGNQSATYHDAGGSTMNAAAIGNTGDNQGFSNEPPFLVMNWCIALTGIFPSRS